MIKLFYKMNNKFKIFHKNNKFQINKKLHKENRKKFQKALKFNFKFLSNTLTKQLKFVTKFNNLI